MKRKSEKDTERKKIEKSVREEERKAGERVSGREK
jgi:hypothetical protein